MSAIYDALIRQRDRIIELEKATDAAVNKTRTLQAQARKRQSAQPDLFSTMPPVNGNVIGPVSFDQKAMARKLDLAIDRIEQVLREG